MKREPAKPNETIEELIAKLRLNADIELGETMGSQKTLRNVDFTAEEEACVFASAKRELKRCVDAIELAEKSITQYYEQLAELYKLRTVYTALTEKFSNVELAILLAEEEKNKKEEAK